jgi:hypothetical protein
MSSTRSYYLASSIFIAIPRFGSIGREVPPNKPLQRSPSAPAADARSDGRQSAGPVCDLQVIEVLEVPGVCGDEG